MARLSFTQVREDLPPWAVVEEPYALFGTFLMSDVQEDADQTSELMREVELIMDGSSQPFSGAKGNGFDVQVNPALVTISTIYAAEPMESAMPTKEFHQLLASWLRYCLSR